MSIFPDGGEYSRVSVRMCTRCFCVRRLMVSTGSRARCCAFFNAASGRSVMEFENVLEFSDVDEDPFFIRIVMVIRSLFMSHSYRTLIMYYLLYFFYSIFRHITYVFHYV